MIGFLQKIRAKFFKNQDDLASNSTFHNYKKKKLDSQKQAELESLYYQLLNKTEYVTSGKLQFLGLDKIKNKLGRKWTGLQSVVYETAEEIISQNISPDDLHFLYKEDSFVIIFTKSELGEIQEKLALIAEEIRRRLFILDEEDLRRIEVKQQVKKTETKSFLDNEFPEMLNSIFQHYKFVSTHKTVTKASEIETITVDTTSYKSGGSTYKVTSEQHKNLDFSYLPMWDVKRGALTTYICLSKNQTEKADDLAGYQLLFHGKNEADIAALDIAILEHVLHEIKEMERDGRQLIIMCPVHYETLHHFESYEVYKTALQKIKENQIQFLNLLVVTPKDNKLPNKDIFWFVPPLKPFCYNIFALVPLQQDLNYQVIKATGIDALGIRIDTQNFNEEENLGYLNNLASKARYFKIPKTFALGVSSLSVTTSLVCSGFDYLSGLAIHEIVAKPDIIHRYRYEDLLSDIIKH